MTEPNFNILSLIVFYLQAVTIFYMNFFALPNGFDCFLSDSNLLSLNDYLSYCFYIFYDLYLI
jgi:hypothetical protein